MDRTANWWSSRHPARSPAGRSTSPTTAAAAPRWGVTPTVLRLGPKEADALLTSGPPELAVIAAWVTNHRHGAVALDLAQRAFRRAESIADEALREKTWWSILTVLHR
nr:hypothetical protein [Deltaproteobacteria bacterium]